MRASFLMLSFMLVVCSSFLSTGFAADTRQSASSAHQLVLKEGDRIVLIGNTFADQMRLYNYLETLLTSQADVKGLTFRNLAWSGDTLKLQPRPLNFGSLDDHLKQQKADVIIACFGMNESFDGQAGLKAYTEHWEQFLKHLASQKYNGVSAPRVVMISPIAHENMGPPFPDPAAHNQSLSEYTRAMQVIAEKHRVPFVDLFTETRKRMAQNPSQKLTRNGIHLNEYGYWAVSQFIAGKLLGKKIQSPQLLADMQAKTVAATNATISQQTFEPERIQFTFKASVLPIPAAPESAIVDSDLQAAQPRLAVKHLPDGKYRLLVNGTTITEASAADWGRGLYLQNLPAQAQVNELRSHIDRKNELFFYVYRAHNAEYIFGRRTKPFGAVSFPPEMLTFAALIEGRESKIGSQARPQKETRWQLVRIE
ncbi:GDSL-like Lipase/Acylhydrolase [Gimesia alba]|uniref:GDSL-like Lipase/Acylhydrolase n=1 Tax=Gimesia alba TaxID=2527973 RepID=A0A517RMA1_9PLAN|nr:SGNH/GDSL hydrolase family protein [Gimesia alba]QDT44974.1 GDSL-like Lipase/Acylhydrolase [Gimesia alba]